MAKQLVFGSGNWKSWSVDKPSTEYQANVTLLMGADEDENLFTREV